MGQIRIENWAQDIKVLSIQIVKNNKYRIIFINILYDLVVVLLVFK